jgi:hypothetical protein
MLAFYEVQNSFSTESLNLDCGQLLILGSQADRNSARSLSVFRRFSLKRVGSRTLTRSTEQSNQSSTSPSRHGQETTIALFTII